MERTPRSTLIVAAKRSGTNFVHEILSTAHSSNIMEAIGLHNEGQSPLNPWRYSGKDMVSEKFGHAGFADDPFGVLQVKSFLGWAREGGKLLKETDAFPLPWLLASVDFNTVAISRDPRDSIASFKRGGLYDRWDYPPKMNQLARTVREHPDLQDYASIIPLNITDEPRHRQLAYFYACTLKEIDRVTGPYQPHKVSYDDLVENPLPAFEAICRFLAIPFSAEMQKNIEQHTTETRDGGVHGTYKKRSDIRSFTDSLTVDEANDILAISQDFGLNLKQSTAGTKFSAVPWKELVVKEKAGIPLENKGRDAVIAEQRGMAVPIGNAMVSSTLTTNEQYAQFLYWLEDNGIKNEHEGKAIFYNDRPQSTLHSKEGVWQAEEGKADHPVMFLSWIGAYAFSRWLGGRLLTRDEWSKTMSNQPSKGNYGQAFPGTTPVEFFPPNEKGIFDSLGNVGTWLEKEAEGENKYDAPFAGIGWNHNEQKLDSNKRRFLWLGTSSLGLRVAFEDKPEGSEEGFKANLKEVTKFITEDGSGDIDKLFSMLSKL